MAGFSSQRLVTASITALIAGQTPALAQTVLWGDAQPNPAPVYAEPSAPVYSSPTPPVYSEPVAPVYTSPNTQPGIIYSQPQPQAQTQPAPVYTTTAPAPTELGPHRQRPAAALVEELNDLIAIGERYRAASPGFLDDLKALSAKYQAELAAQPRPLDPQPQVAIAPPPPVSVEQPAPVYETPIVEQPQPAPIVSAPQASVSANVFLQDNFADGDFATNPTWSPRQGEWRVDPQFGLRPVTAQAQAQAPLGPQDLLQVLLGGQAPQRPSAGSEPSAHLIEATVPIGNAFSLAANITAHEARGAVHFIMHQAGESWPGYRLELRSGGEPLVVLTRRGASGYKDIMKVAAPGFTTDRNHELRWARLSDGQMFVILNGEPLITARDTVFRQDWTGFALFNAGGDVSVRDIRIAAPIER